MNNYEVKYELPKLKITKTKITRQYKTISVKARSKLGARMNAKKELGNSYYKIVLVTFKSKCNDE